MRMFFSRCRGGGSAEDGGCKIRSLEETRLFFTRSAASGPTSQTSAAECFRSKTRVFFTRLTDAPLLIALALLLTVAGGGLGMGLPVVLLIVGMGLTPFPPAVADHLRVFRVSRRFSRRYSLCRLAWQPAGCKRLDRDGAWKVGRLAGNTGSSVAGKSFPPRYVWGPTLRKSDPSALSQTI